MGMFNTVNFTMPCPSCGKEIGEFQTKDDFYDMLYCEVVDFRSVRKFYTCCHSCDAWIEFTLKEDWAKRTIDDYTLKITKLGEKNEGPEENSTTSMSN
jgi:hypothetical protein